MRRGAIYLRLAQTHNECTLLVGVEKGELRGGSPWVKSKALLFLDDGLRHFVELGLARICPVKQDGLDKLDARARQMLF